MPRKPKRNGPQIDVGVMPAGETTRRYRAFVRVNGQVVYRSDPLTKAEAQEAALSNSRRIREEIWRSK